jgi:hypothetical protein
MKNHHLTNIFSENFLQESSVPDQEQEAETIPPMIINEVSKQVVDNDKA